MQLQLDESEARTLAELLRRECTPDMGLCDSCGEVSKVLCRIYNRLITKQPITTELGTKRLEADHLKDMAEEDKRLAGGG